VREYPTLLLREGLPRSRREAEAEMGGKGGGGEIDAAPAA
jgi:hypothetical protein